MQAVGPSPQRSCLLAMSMGEGRTTPQMPVRVRPILVPKVTHAGEHHGNPGFVGSRNYFVVAHRTTRLNHRSDAIGSSVIQTVAEREEGVGGHHRAGNLQAGVLSLDSGDTRGVDAAHLAGADTDGLAVFRVDDGVGFNELGHFPGEDQVMDFLLARCTLSNDLQVFGLDHADIAALHQQATVDAFEVPASAALGRPFAAFQQAYVGFGGDYGASLCADFRGDDHFYELALDDGLGGGTVQFAVEGDDAAESRFGISGVGQLIGLADAAFAVQRHGHAARVGVLDDDASRFDEALHAFQRSVGVGHVVERQFLALQLDGCGHAGFTLLRFHVERRALVRVLAVAHFLSLDELAVEGARESAALFGTQGVAALVDGAQVVGDHPVVGRGVLEGFQRQVEALGVAQAAGFQRLDDAGVVTCVDHNRHVFVVLRGGADHGWAADVDVLDGVGQVTTRLGHGGSEGGEVDRDQVDRLDAVLVHYCAVEGATAEDAAMDFRVQGLDATVHHFREAGVVGDFHSSDAVVLEQLVSAASGEDFHIQGDELAGKLEDAGLVGNTDQGTANGEAGGLVGHFRVHQGGSISKKGGCCGPPFSGVRGQSRSYCLSFLRRVPRFRPSSSEALVWLPLT